MIVTHKESNLKYIVASIIKVPGQENLFKLEDEAGASQSKQEASHITS